ncbi:MAG TPA: DUF2203 domain-containing protein [Nitrolancea sp.]|nr:DUF2203 domain-containing protein [Nitrolancea sp.]
MTEQREPKLYTVAEARATVDLLRPLLLEIRTLRQEIAEHTAVLKTLTPDLRGNGHAADVSRREMRISRCVELIRARLSQIEALDIEVKDLETGLVDFYSLRDDRIVYLCWSIDEPTVAFWHDLDTGFLGRQPLDP